MAISTIPRTRAWMFSSVTSAGRPANTPRIIASNASMAGSMATESRLAPSNPAVSAASSRLSVDV